MVEWLKKPVSSKVFGLGNQLQFRSFPRHAKQKETSHCELWIIFWQLITPPCTYARVTKRWKKGKAKAAKGKKTCPADGPALRARKAQSTGEAKRPGQNKFWQNASYPPWIWIDSQLAKQAGILVYSFWHRLQNLHKPPQPPSV